MTMHWIATTNGNGTSALTFDNIPQTFQHLELRISGRGGQNGAQSSLYLGVYDSSNNSPTGFSIHRLYGDGASVTNSATANQGYHNMPGLPAATAPANTYGTMIVNIYDYANTSKLKTMVNLAGQNHTSTNDWAGMSSSMTLGFTAAIKKLTVDTEGSFTTNSVISLYGITNNPVLTGV